MKTTSSGYITIDDVRKLLVKRMGLRVSRSAIYGYVARKGFPPNTGLGRPRLWRKDRVEAWIESFKEAV